MAWIESHQEVARHPKTRRLALKLGVSRVTAIGHLHLLWWWALSFAQDGDLTSIEPETIAEEAMWDGEPGAFLVALRESGWLDATDDGRLLIHDWHKYAGKLIDARKKDADRKREARAQQAELWEMSAGHPTDVRSPSEVTVPYPTEPNRTEPIVAADAATPAALPDETGPPKRPDQAIFDVLVRRFDQPTNAQERGKFNKAVQLFRQSGCDAAEVEALIATAEERWGAISITPVGVAGNVSNLRRPPRATGPPANGVDKVMKALANRAARRMEESA